MELWTTFLVFMVLQFPFFVNLLFGPLSESRVVMWDSNYTKGQQGNFMNKRLFGTAEMSASQQACKLARARTRITRTLDWVGVPKFCFELSEQFQLLIPCLHFDVSHLALSHQEGESHGRQQIGQLFNEKHIFSFFEEFVGATNDAGKQFELLVQVIHFCKGCHKRLFALDSCFFSSHLPITVWSALEDWLSWMLCCHCALTGIC